MDTLTARFCQEQFQRKNIEIEIIDIREYAYDKHKNCDDDPYGGGAGMVLKPEPIMRALDSINAYGKKTVYPTPAGRLFGQAYAHRLSLEEEIVFICGRYEGIDQRVIDAYVTDEISIGDYVVSGGEVAVMVMIDAVLRLVRGVINSESLREESFSGGLLEYPHYTRPEVYRGMKVPEILLSGNHEKIRQWRLRSSVNKTLKYRPELIDLDMLPPEVQQIAKDPTKKE